MVAKVIGYDESVKKKVVCKNCAAIIEYVPKDLTTWTTSSCGERGTATGFGCPGCGYSIVISST